jgi:hypothetical protein
MKFDWDLVLNVLIALLIFAVLEKLVLNSLLAKIPELGSDSYEQEV